MSDERRPVTQGEYEVNDANIERGGNSPKGTLEETKKPKVDNPRELDDARYAALDVPRPQ